VGAEYVVLERVSDTDWRMLAPVVPAIDDPMIGS
jgi:hypothetical protein